jgi:glycosidase
MTDGARPMDANAQLASVPQLPMSLDLLGGDVWAWEKRITGRCVGVTADAVIELLVNGVAMPVDRDGETFEASVRLQPGGNTLQAVATDSDGLWVTSNQVVHTVRLSPRPVARMRLSASELGIHLDGTSSEPSEYDSAAITSYAWDLHGLSSPVGSRVTHSISVPDQNGDYEVSLTVTDARGRVDTATDIFTVEAGSARIVDPVREEPRWTKGATVYGVVVRNVGPDGFQSVIEHLDDLADLGIAALWLTPITGRPEGDFGYAVTDYFDVEPKYGTLEDFRGLVQEAHARGIRVLMDFVPNHTSAEHPYFLDSERNGPASQYYDFYDRDEKGSHTWYFNWTHLPNLNFENPEVRRFMTEAFMFWVRELDVDGFRVDVAWGIKLRRPDYWLQFSAEFHRVKPDGLLIAEASSRDPYYVNNGFGAAYDWTDDLGVWAWTDVFQGDEPISESIRKALTHADGRGYDPDSFIFRFLNNNDTGPRFVTTHGVDLYRVASAMLLMLPGLPCLFTGDEVGAEYQPYGLAGPIDWIDHHGLRSHFRKLVHLRKSHEALRDRQWIDLPAVPTDRVFGFLRPAADPSKALAVLLNFGNESVDATLDLSILRGSQGTEMFLDLYNDETDQVDGGAVVTVPMPAWGIRILEALYD